jgi:hypothetical protein
MTGMNIQALSPLVQKAAGPVSGASAVTIAADLQQTLTTIAQTPNLSGAQRSSLTQAVATVAQSVQTTAVRVQTLNQITNMGIYLATTQPEGFPRWNVMTALRAYGLNLQQTPKLLEQAAVQAVQQQLNALAEQVRPNVAENPAVITTLSAAASVAPAVAKAVTVPVATPTESPEAATTAYTPVDAVA